MRIKPLITFIAVLIIKFTFSQVIETTHNIDIFYNDSLGESSDTIFLDINQDSQSDFVFNIRKRSFQILNSNFTSVSMGLRPLIYNTDTNKAIASYESFTSTESFYFIDTIGTNDSICEESLVYDSIMIIASYVLATNGSGQRIGDFYVNNTAGVSFYDQNQHLFYGGIKISLNHTCDSATIHSSYYMPNGNCINLSNIKKNNLSDIDIIISNDHVKINAKQNQIIEEIRLLSLNGQLLNQKINTTRIDISNINSGIYIIQVKMDDGNIATAKFFKN